MSLSLTGRLVVDFLHSNAVIFIPSLLLINVLFLILVLVNVRSKRKVYKRYYNRIRDFEETNLDYMLSKLGDRLNFLEQKFRGLEKASQTLEDNLSYAIQHLGVVRYNAFSDIGSDLSFSIALLDQKGDGVVVTSIYGREESRTFAKPVKNRNSTYLLTDEEKEAIAKAMGRLA
jgi:hypothetical protein